MAEKREQHTKKNVYNYVKEHHRKGHSLGRIKKWLVMYGYDESFVSGIIRRFRARQFARTSALSAFIVALVLLFVSVPFFKPNISGAAVASLQGCCIDNSGICRSDTRDFCNSEGSIYIKYSCFDLPYCSNNTLP
ncbi:hypothetical protein J4458_03235 [Candidatus Woesearchaeota archaeon]|nr:hypothetical protein [Candidatus Woesearchaeota archaeon]